MSNYRFPFGAAFNTRIARGLLSLPLTLSLSLLVSLALSFRQDSISEGL